MVLGLLCRNGSERFITVQMVSVVKQLKSEWLLELVRLVRILRSKRKGRRLCRVTLCSLPFALAGSLAAYRFALLAGVLFRGTCRELRLMS